MASRRSLLKGLAAAALLPTRGWSAAGAPAWLAAGHQRNGRHALHGIGPSGNIVFAVALPGRGHAAAAHPDRAEAVGFARRPGLFGIVLDCRTGAVLHRLSPPQGLQFNGHGAFSEDGVLLYTSEVVADGSAGRVGIWDAGHGYARLGDLDSHGIGPHELRRMPGGRIVIANGGIATDPHDRTPLNLDEMRPNLTILDADGGLISRRELPATLRQNSIRHLAPIDDGVAFGMQWQGDPTEQVPLLGLARGDRALTVPPADMAGAAVMRGYVGSIAATDDLIVTTSPRGGVAMLHDRAGQHLTTLRRADLCGAAPAPAGGFGLTDGGGAIWRADPDGLDLLQRHDLAWDNHLVPIAT